MPRHFDEDYEYEEYNIASDPQEEWEEDPGSVPISAQETPISDRALEEAYERVGYDHKNLLRTIANAKNSVSEMQYRLKLLNDVYISKIVDGIYISNAETAHAYLRGGYNTKGQNWPQIRYVLSIMDPKPTLDDEEDICDELEPRDRYEFPEENHLFIRISDNKKSNILEWFPIICKFIHTAIQARESLDDGILVHCRKGMSRSVAAVMAYLIWAHRLSASDALDEILINRPVACPNSGFYEQCGFWHWIDCNFWFEDAYGDRRMKPTHIEYVLSRELRGGPPHKEDTMVLEGVERPAPR